MRNDPVIRRLEAPFTAGMEAKWASFLGTHANGSFFQSPDFISLFEGCRNYEPLVLVAEKPGGEITGILTAAVISDRIYGIPFGRVLVQGGPVISGPAAYRTAVLRAMLEGLKGSIPPETVFVEIRNLERREEDDAVFRETGFAWQDHLNDVLPVKPFDEVFHALKPAKQRQVRRGLENGAVIRPASSLREVEDFYRLLAGHYKTRVRKPLPPVTFFRNFYRIIQAADKGVILVVSHQDVVIGGMMCPFSGRHTVYEWYVCSLRGELKHLYPGVLATWAGIGYAIGNNFKAFDFMGIGSPHKSYGVRNFKTQFGGEIVNFGRWMFINNKLRYSIGTAGYRLLKPR